MNDIQKHARGKCIAPRVFPGYHDGMNAGFLLSVLLGVALGVALCGIMREGARRRVEFSREKRGGGRGFSGVNEKRGEAKERAKERIFLLFEAHREIRNDHVEEFLGVSDATATKYLDELETEGKIVQIGKRGRGVSYRLSN